MKQPSNVSTGKRMRQLAFVFMLSLVLIVMGCAQQLPDDADSGASDSGSSEPSSGGKVSIPIVADPTFNPWHPSAYAESNVINRVLFSGLTKPGKDLLPAPALAETWEVSEDGLEWTFHLQEGVKWHDGEPFTAEDVAFTFNEIALNEDLGANNASYFKDVKEVEVVDDHTVAFHMESPVASLPARLSFNTEILPKHLFAGEDPWELTSFNKGEPVGTGPFKIKSYTSGQSVVLEKNEDFYGGAPLLDEVEYKVLPDANTHIAQALSNELSIFALEDTSAIERVEKADNVEIHPQNTTNFFWISLNQEYDKFTDVRVRQAMLHAIDRQAIIDTVLQGYATIADAGISPSLEEYYTDDVTRYEYDPDRARELLAEAGWEDNDGNGIVEKDGEPFTIQFDIGIQGDLEPISQMVQQYLIEVGFDVKLNTMDWNTMIDQVVIQRDFEMTLNWWRYPSDPDLLPYFHSSTAGTGNNIPGYKDEKLDELLEQGSQTADVAERQEIYADVQQYMSDTLPYVFLWYPQEAQLRNSQLQGVPDLAFGDALYYINEWYLDN